MSSLRLIAACGLSLLLAVAYAQTDQDKGLNQAIESVDKNLERNLEKDPNHASQKGLQRASDQLKENQVRIEAERTESGRSQGVERPSRPEFAGRPAVIERPQRPERAARHGK